MDLNLDVSTHQFKGTQKLIYTNNSNDTLKRVFYHLYFNAFQPNSMMDIRSRSIADPDPRVKNRIFNLKKDEIGKQIVTSLKQDGFKLSYKTVGTVLEVTLVKAILPRNSTTFDMIFEGQVPLQIRRSGRDNKEGIAYTMTQWYPKISEYDYQGWHSNPYVGREFYGVWGNFDVKITLDASFVLAGTGYIQNPNEVGYGYQSSTHPVRHNAGSKLTWHFKAPKVHDFAWAADPDFTHIKRKVKNGPTLHFFYQKEQSIDKAWEQLPFYTEKILLYLNKHNGIYPFKQYSVIQGGDGGMEYPMCTMITGKRKLNSIVGVTAHEFAHSWYQMLLGTNEILYAWMDEGFTTYASSFAMRDLFSKDKSTNPNLRNVRRYSKYSRSGFEEPLSTHADYFEKNYAYGMSSYVKGAAFLVQLEYIIGETALQSSLLRYFDKWKYKHPNPNSFKRILEDESNIQLSWFFEYWIYTTKKIDYSIRNVTKEGDKTIIKLERISPFPMPIDVTIRLRNSEEQRFYIPLTSMRGKKEKDSFMGVPQKTWDWVNPFYKLKIDTKYEDIELITIDKSERLADYDLHNNTLFLR